MPVDRIWLDVTYEEKDTAKAAGARWDPDARRWYAPRPGIAALDPWLARPPLPELLPGEDRTLGCGLFVDLVPESCWFTNARSCISTRDWQRIQQMVLGRAGARCEVCGATRDREQQRWLEVHERWTYDDDNLLQTLRRLICLCTQCHQATHFGLANVRGRADQARAHLLTVTGMTDLQARRHIDDAFTLWQQRSRRTWSLDLSILTNANIALAAAPTAQGRPPAADRRRVRRGDAGCAAGRTGADRR
ncbi:MAG TPA: DUF5710 domain-containing protein [Kineosporiaceae bacterium]